LYDPFEIPSLEQIEEMERQQAQAVEALEISISEAGEPQNVKCQGGGRNTSKTVTLLKNLLLCIIISAV
jgi:hypothetical protein